MHHRRLGTLLALLSLLAALPTVARAQDGTAPSMAGSWVGTEHAIGEARPTTADVRIDFSQSDAWALAGTRQTKSAAGAWADAGLVGAAVLSDGEIDLVDVDGVAVGLRRDDGVLELARLRLGPDPAAALDLLSNDGSAAEASPEASEVAARLAGTWTGGAVGIETGTAATVEPGLAVVFGGDGPVLTGTVATRPAGSDVWGDPIPMQAVVLADGSVHGADEEGYLHGTLRADGTLELALLRPGQTVGAYHALLAADGASAPLAGDGSLAERDLVGEWDGQLTGFVMGAMGAGDITFVFADEGAWGAVGRKRYKPAGKDWRPWDDTSVVVLSDGTLHGVDGDGILSGLLRPDGTLELGYLEKGMADHALRYALTKP